MSASQGETVARNYAETLLTLGRRADDAAGWGVMLRQVASAIATDNTLARFLESPRIATEQKSLVLTRALADDPHFGPYMAIPGKDNGFDIEGLAVDGHRLLLGLRGPVLRGWSALLEIAVEARADQLRLVPLDDSGTLIRKHFLQLDGLGVRDLHFCGDDLYILAGPTMVLNGDIRVFKWSGARPLLAVNRDPVRFESVLSESVALPHGRGTNRAEALCDLPAALSGGKARWLVLYDAPGADRREGEHTVFGDLLRHD
jgi:hypothetical protein